MIDVNAYLGHFAFRQLRHNTGPGLVRFMDRFGIRQAVVASAAALTYRNPQPGNEEVAAEVEGQRSRLVPFAVLNPAYAGWEHDLKVCHERFGMKGVRLFPRWHDYSLTDPRCRKLVDAATERRMTISLPVRIEDPRQQGWLVRIPDLPLDEIESLVRSSPKARFIVANASGFGGSILGRPGNGLPGNYAVEMARLGIEGGNEIGRLLDVLGEDRVLLGTGMPFQYPGPALLKLDLLQAPEAVKERIRSKNAARWIDGV